MAASAGRGWLGWCALLLALGSDTLAAQEALFPGALKNGSFATPDAEQSRSSDSERIDRLEKLNEELLRKVSILEGMEGAGKTDKAPAAAAKADDKTFQVGKSLKFEPSWKNGLWLETPDKAFRFNVGGVIQFDTIWMGANQQLVESIGEFNNYIDPKLAMQDSFDLRRARLRFAGQLYEQFEFYAQYDFAQSIDLRRRTIGIGGSSIPNYDFDPADATLFNEVYVGLMKVPYLGQVRVGRHRESLNFITATSDTNQVWMERGLMFDAFNGDYNFSNGITVANSYFDDRAYSLIGWFMQNNGNRTFASVGDGEYVYDARLTCLPVWDEENERWVHLGVDYSYRNLHLNQVRYRARPMLRDGSSFQVPNILNTGTIFSRDAQQIANLEFAASLGRWTIAAEAACSWVTNAYTGALPLADGTLPKDAKFRGTYFAQGGYVECLYFLTPDHRNYRKDRPGYDRVVPRSNFYFLKGENGTILTRGAWEVGVRYDYVDLTNSEINGGTGQAVTLALNWYLHPNFRVQANYFWMDRRFNPADTDGRVDGPINGFGMRFNCDF